MSAKHTPGPWSVGSHRSIQSASGTICETYSHMGIDVADSNERLIAAAPELLEALIFCIDGLRAYAPEHMHGLQKDSYIRKASSAIAKATGEPQC